MKGEGDSGGGVAPSSARSSAIDATVTAATANVIFYRCNHSYSFAGLDAIGCCYSEAMMLILSVIIMAYHYYGVLTLNSYDSMPLTLKYVAK